MVLYDGDGVVTFKVITKEKKMIRHATDGVINIRDQNQGFLVFRGFFL